MVGPLVVLPLVIVGVGAVLWLCHRRHAGADSESQSRDEHGESAAVASASADDVVCCGRHLVCERGLEDVGNVVYFDDEELDVFAGRGGGEYSDEEAEQFREVLTTLAEGERVAWARSLERRGVTMPDEVRDELLLLLGDAG